MAGCDSSIDSPAKAADEEEIMEVVSEPLRRTSLSSMSSSSSSSFCPLHNTLLSHFCVSHATYCCATCAHLTHGQCQDLKKVGDMASRQRAARRETMATISQLQRQFQHLKSNMRLQLHEIEQRIAFQLEEIAATRKAIEAILDGWEAKAKFAVKATALKQSQFVMNEMLICDNTLDALKRRQVVLEGALHDGTIDGVLAPFRLDSNDCLYYRLQLNELMDGRTDNSNSGQFLASDSLRSLLDALQELGQLKTTTFKHDSHSVPPAHNENRHEKPRCTRKQLSVEGTLPVTDDLCSDSIGDLKVCRDKPAPMTLVQRIPKDANPKEHVYKHSKLAGKFEIRVPSDKWACSILGMVELPDGTFLLADAGNNKLKHLDQHFRCKAALQLPSAPWGVSVINHGEVAVTLPGLKRIQFVNIGSGLTIGNSFPTRGCCRGIAYLRGRCECRGQGQLVVSSNSPSQVEFMDLRGSVKRRIEKDANGTDLFKSPYNLCVNENQSIVYVTDFGMSRMFAMATDGHVLFSSERFRGPGGLTTDRKGHLIVVEWSANKVQACDPKGENVRQLVSNVRHYPWSVLLTRRTDRLVLGLNSDLIQVYKLK